MKSMTTAHEIEAQIAELMQKKKEIAKREKAEAKAAAAAAVERRRADVLKIAESEGLLDLDLTIAELYDGFRAAAKRIQESVQEIKEAAENGDFDPPAAPAGEDFDSPF